MILRYYQQEASDKTINFLNTTNENGLLALPTGSGKSVIIADIIKRLPDKRILKLVHTQKIIQQNAERLKQHYPECDLGICSSGIGLMQTSNQIIFGGIATVVNRTAEIGHIDLIIIDEVHTFSTKENSMYFKTYCSLKEINPNIRMIGLSATPFRMGKGLIVDGQYFHKTIYDLCSWQAYNKLVEEGFLSDIITYSPKSAIDTTGVRVQNGDFNLTELQEVVKKNDITTKALKEAVIGGSDRKKWMCFGVGIDHVVEISKTLNELGVSSVCVHSKMSESSINEAFEGFKSDKYKCIVSNNMIIAGFDEPRIDFIACLRPTKSSSLWVQMIGRGCRPHPDKKNLYVMDFANNALTCGCINDPVIPKAKGTKKGEPPVKICPSCSCYNHLSARICIVCGALFPIQKHITKIASSERLIRKENTEPKTSICVKQSFEVRIQKSKPYLLIKYNCEGVTLYDFFQPFGPEWWKIQKAKKWWKQRVPNREIPPKLITIVENKDIIPKPTKITWKYGKKYPVIVSSEYNINGQIVVIENSLKSKSKT